MLTSLLGLSVTAGAPAAQEATHELRRGHISSSPDAIPQPTGPVAAGSQRWYFPAWQRDVDAGGPTSSGTHGVAITFL